MLVEGGAGTGALTCAAVIRQGGLVLHATASSRAEVDSAIFAVGALGPSDTEGERWKRAVEQYRQINSTAESCFFVARTLWVPRVVELLRYVETDPAKKKWTVLRPGALEDGEDWSEDNALLTPDIRVNGRISRPFLASLLAYLAIHGKRFDEEVVGVYDDRRLISRPPRVKNLFAS